MACSQIVIGQRRDNRTRTIQQGPPHPRLYLHGQLGEGLAELGLEAVLEGLFGEMGLVVLLLVVAVVAVVVVILVMVWAVVVERLLLEVVLLLMPNLVLRNMRLRLLLDLLLLPLEPLLPL
jgi:hypothetical protein